MACTSPAVWLSVVNAEAVKRGQLAPRGDFEDRATAAKFFAVSSAHWSCAVEISGRLTPAPREGGRRQVRLESKAVERGQLAPGGDFEHRAVAVGSAESCRAIEFSVQAPNERPEVRVSAVGALETHKSRGGLYGRAMEVAVEAPDGRPAGGVHRRAMHRRSS